MKSARQQKIIDIISTHNIETQQQLIDALNNEGCVSTQATVSRDIKELRLRKELSSDGRYKYSAVASVSTGGHMDRLRTIFRESVTSLDSAQNIVVIKTLPGLASAACSAIDGMDINGLVGSLAGDDTAFLVMRDTAAAELFCSEIKTKL
jgi:transcriptional regulator of arginine metabolism